MSRLQVPPLALPIVSVESDSDSDSGSGSITPILLRNLHPALLLPVARPSPGKRRHSWMCGYVMLILITVKGSFLTKVVFTKTFVFRKITLILFTNILQCLPIRYFWKCTYHFVSYVITCLWIIKHILLENKPYVSLTCRFVWPVYWIPIIHVYWL